MGKQGPCFHCGVASTPLWRNGPPDKPVLCNACGSRWRTKGSLANYRPLHSRGETTKPVQPKAPKDKHVFGKTKEQKLHKRKLNESDLESEDGTSDYASQNGNVLEEESSNHSSSGSAVSYSESCAQFGTSDPIEFTGSSQSIVWDSLIPSRKRTLFFRKKPKPSPVEKLTKDLYSILHEQESPHLSASTVEDLLLESVNPMGSNEIGHGTVLIKNPRASPEEESETSSVVIQNKSGTVSEYYSTSSSLPMHVQGKELSSIEISVEKLKNAAVHGSHDHAERIKVPSDKFQTLQSSSSLLRFIDLKDFVNYEDFMANLTHEEQKQLMKYLPSIDTLEYPSSLRKMFDSYSFKETLFTYQKLLSDGIFDLTFSEATIEACKMLKKFVLYEPTKSRWVEKYVQLKNLKDVGLVGSNPDFPQSSLGYDRSVSMMQIHDRKLHPNFSETKHKMKSPNKLQKCENTDIPFSKSLVTPNTKQGANKYEDIGTVKIEVARFSPGSVFASPLDQNSAVLDSLQFSDDKSEQDLLLDVPSNMSFHQAELLDSILWRQRSFPGNSSVEAHDGQRHFLGNKNSSQEERGSLNNF